MAYYRARRTVNRPSGGLIMPGEVVPDDHPRLQDGLMKGFIERIEDEGEPPPPTPPEPGSGDLPATEGWPPTPDKDKAAIIARGSQEATVFKEPMMSERRAAAEDQAAPAGEPKAPSVPRGTMGPQTAIAELDFMVGPASDSLELVGVSTLADLRGWTREGLMNVPKIGPMTADKLLMAYEAACGPADG